MSQTNARLRAFRIAFLITFVLLVIQHVLGMISNLEVQFPSTLPEFTKFLFSHSTISGQSQSVE